MSKTFSGHGNWPVCYENVTFWWKCCSLISESLLAWRWGPSSIRKVESGYKDYNSKCQQPKPPWNQAQSRLVGAVAREKKVRVLRKEKGRELLYKPRQEPNADGGRHKISWTLNFTGYGDRESMRNQVAIYYVFLCTSNLFFSLYSPSRY